LEPSCTAQCQEPRPDPPSMLDHLQTAFDEFDHKAPKKSVFERAVAFINVMSLFTPVGEVITLKEVTISAPRIGSARAAQRGGVLNKIGGWFGRIFNRAEKGGSAVTEESGSNTYDGLETFDDFARMGGDDVAGAAVGSADRGVTSTFSLTKHGELTNGVYTVSKEAMKKHVFDLGQGKSIFYPSLNAEEAVLKAAQYADEAGLWIGNKAKVPVLNTNIGRLGNDSPTNVINVYRNSNGFIHGSPGTIR
jgi:hypothetical protein